MPRGRVRSDPDGLKREITSIRLTESERSELDRRARNLGLTRTDFMVRAALGQPLGDEHLDDRVEALERRIGRLEELAFRG